MKKYIFILLSCFSYAAFATHMRSGEITYKFISNYTYQITLTTYTKGTSSAADRCTEQINFGDGDSQMVCRSNFEAGDPTTDPWGAAMCTGNPSCTTHHMGEWSNFNLCLNMKRNVYTTTHTFPGPGSYVISFTEPNRMNGLINISDMTPLFIADTLSIPYYYVGNVNSPDYSNPAVDTAQIGICHTYNSLATDPDGDSLSYQLINCMDAPNHPITGYFIPAGVSMDAVTGDLTWCSPQQLPPPYQTPYYYNFAFQIKKWRNVNGNILMVAAVMRDIQIIVQTCAGMAVNEPQDYLPQITISPNPSVEFVHIEAINLKRLSYDLVGYDITGKEAFRKNGIEEENYTFSTSKLKSGLYLLQAYSEGKKIYSGKLQVEH